jgi:anti-sigma-K factor RskA
MRPHEWYLEHAIEYATRTLDAGEAREFESHLGGCESCQVEVARIESDLRWLPMGAERAAPRPGAERRIVEGVLGAARPAVRRRTSWAMPAALAASLLLAVGAWYLGASRSRALARELEEQRGAVAALQDTLSIWRQTGRILQASLEVGSARGEILIFADEGTHRWNVVIHGLPAASPGHQYQFWFICGDGMVRGTEVDADVRKPTMFTTGMPRPESCAEVKGAALTEEPVSDGQGPPKGKALAHLML